MRGAYVVADLALSAAASYFALGRYLRFAIQRQILDVPNERSSHEVPTPRGGGVAFAAVFFLSVLVLGFAHVLLLQELMAILAGVLVAAIGYWDDRKGLSIRLRFGVQILAASLAVAALAHFHLPGRASLSVGVMAVLVAVEILGMTWLLNLTNFMDGIDGIVGVEVVTVTAVCGGLIWAQHGLTIPALLFAMLGATVAPFLLFNWSPAKIFMGDVGSCFIGFMFGVLSLIAVARHQLSLLTPLILLGVFLCDATSTLLTRMATGQRWYEAHRTHAFQILARQYGHRRVAFGVGVVNLLWLAPLAIAAEYDQAHGVLYAILALMPLGIACRLLGVGDPRSVLKTGRVDEVERSGMVFSLRSKESKERIFSERTEAQFQRFFPPLQFTLMAMLSLVCVYSALMLHFHPPFTKVVGDVLLEVVVLWGVCQTLVFGLFRLHRRHWRFTSVEEFPALVGIGLLGSAFGAACSMLFAWMHGVAIPRPIYFLETAFTILALCGLRVALGQMSSLGTYLLKRGRKPVLIYRADGAGISMLSELRLHYPEYHPIGFLDDRPEVRGISVCGLRVLSQQDDLKKLLKKYSVHYVFISQRVQANSATEAIRSACRAENVGLHIFSSMAITSPDAA